jgi:SAM-dependent methyltransferase
MGLATSPVAQALSRVPGVAAVGIRVLGLAQRIADSGLSPRERWRKHLGSEAGWWERLLARPDRFREQFGWCLDPELEVRQDELRETIEAVPRDVVRIVDVGAGPVTVVGRRYRGRTIEVIPIDPLADVYNNALRKAGVDVPVPTRQLAVEELPEQFGPANIDIAYCHNALDHMPDPLAALESMLSVVAADGFVVIRCLPDEGKRNAYFGIHQWNVDLDGTDLAIWNRSTRHLVGDALADRAEVVDARMIGKWVTAVLRPRAASSDG